MTADYAGGRIVDDRRAEVRGQQKQPNGTSRHIQHSPGTPTTGLRERGNDASRSTGRSGRQNAATRRNTRRGEQVTVQGPVKKQDPDGMSHRGGGGGNWNLTLESERLSQVPCGEQASPAQTGQTRHSETIVCSVNGGFCMGAQLDWLLHRFIYCFTQG